MVRIRRFGVVRTATMAAALYAFIILVTTLLIFLPIALIAGAAGREATGSLGIGAVGAVGVVIFGLVGAVVYAVIGWVMTAIGCVVYNLVAGMVGGIEVQLEGVTPPSTPAWGGPYAVQPGYGTPPGYGNQPGYGQAPGGPPQPPGWGGQG